MKTAYVEGRRVYAHIAIPVDGSEAATRAAECGLGLARLFDATVDVVHVGEPMALRLTSSAEGRKRLTRSKASETTETPCSVYLTDGRG